MLQLDYKATAFWPERFTLDWLISTLKYYDELRARDSTRHHAALFASAEAISRIADYNDKMTISAVLKNAPGIGRITLLCDELDNSDGLTAANVIKLRATVCRAKPCTLEAANALTLDEVADAAERRVLAKAQDASFAKTVEKPAEPEPNGIGQLDDNQPPGPPEVTSETPDHQFLEISGGKQRALLTLLQGKGKVPISTLLNSLYGSKRSRDPEDALKKLKTRVNKTLAEMNYGLEVKKEGETYSLVPIEP